MAQQDADPIENFEGLESIGDDDLERYARHLVLPELGARAQVNIARAHVAIIGCGGLGANAALTLAQSGIGALSLFDPDTVDRSNLHRQPFGDAQVGMLKVAALAELCQARNPKLTVHTSAEAFAGSDVPLWLEGTDSYASRAAIDALRPPMTKTIFGSVIGMDAQVSVFAGAFGFRDLFPTPPTTRQTCAEQGVLGPLALMTAQIMAAEALRLAAGQPSPLAGQLLMIDARDWRQRLVRGDP